MKLGTPIFIVLLVAFSFLAIGIIIEDFRTSYPEVGDVNTSFETQFISYADDINDSFSTVATSLNKVGSEEGGWKNILTGLMAIPVAAIDTIKVLINAPFYIVSILSSVASSWGIDPRLTSIIIVALIVGVILTLVKFAYKSTQQ